MLFKNKFLIIIIFIVAVSLGGLLFVQFFTYTVEGKIIDKATQEPLQGAKISIANFETETRENGEYRIEGIKIFQKKNLKIIPPPGYKEVEEIIVGYPQRKIRRDFALEPTLEKVVNDILSAQVKMEYRKIWDFIHPDDKTYWKSRELYYDKFYKRDKLAKELCIFLKSCVFTGDTTKVDHWESPVTSNIYNDVMKTGISCNIIEEGQEKKVYKELYFQWIEGYYHYFTEMNKEAIDQLIGLYNNRLSLLKSYKDEKYGFEIKYPKDWKIHQIIDRGVILHNPSDDNKFVLGVSNLYLWTSSPFSPLVIKKAGDVITIDGIKIDKEIYVYDKDKTLNMEGGRYHGRLVVGKFCVDKNLNQLSIEECIENPAENSYNLLYLYCWGEKWNTPEGEESCINSFNKIASTFKVLK